jgi:hypothetical protein
MDGRPYPATQADNVKKDPTNNIEVNLNYAA